MRLSIGTLQIVIANLPREWLATKSGHRLTKFFSTIDASSCSSSFLFKLTDSIALPSPEQFRKIQYISFFCDPSSHRQYFVTDEMQSVIDWKCSEMQAVVPVTAKDESADDMMFKVLVQLRLLVSFWVVHRGGLPLHSSSVFKDDSALVFFGRSGIGKTTIAGLMREKSWSLLNDEYNLLMPSGDTYRIFSTPFTKRDPDEIHDPGGMLVKGFFSLARGEYKVEQISQGFQVRLLLKSVYLFPDYSRIQSDLLNNVVSICLALNPCILYFQNTPQTAQTLDQSVSGGSK